jgi:hypothetical protein
MAFTLGGAIYMGVCGLKKLFSYMKPDTVAPVTKPAFVVATPEYAAELAPALSVPLRKTPLVVPAPEYALSLLQHCQLQ